MVDFIGEMEGVGSVCLGFCFSGNKEGAEEKEE